MRLTENRGHYGPVRCMAAVAMVLTLGSCAAATALAAEGESVAREYEVKAAFLYNFATFIDWPEDAVPGADDTFVIGVFGDDPFGPVLDVIAASKTVRNKQIVVRRFTALEDYTPCHILFVAHSERDQIRAVVEHLQGAAVLIVGDSAGFIEAGGMVNLVIEDNKVRFEIDPAATQHAGLKVSSKLLRLARIIKREEDT